MDELKNFANYSRKCLYYDSFFYKLLLSHIGNFWKVGQACDIKSCKATENCREKSNIRDE